jgi:hypothetical protein
MTGSVKRDSNTRGKPHKTHTTRGKIPNRGPAQNRQAISSGWSATLRVSFGANLHSAFEVR